MGAIGVLENQNTKTDKTPILLSAIKQWKDKKHKGKMIVHFDGSGLIPRVEANFDL